MKKPGISPTRKGESPHLFTVAPELPAEQEALTPAPVAEEPAPEPKPSTAKKPGKPSKGRRRISRKPEILDARL